MKINNIIALIKFETRTNIATPLSVFTIIIMYPIIFKTNLEGITQDMYPYILGLFLIMQAMIATIMHVPIKEAINRENKTIKRLVATPVTKIDYIMSGLIAQYLTTLIPVVIMIGLAAKGLSISEIVRYIIIYSLFYVVCYLFGFALASLVNDAQSAKAVGMIIFFIMIVAINTDSETLHIVTYLLPIKQVIDLFKNGLNINNILINMLYAFLFLVIGIKRFKWE